MKLLFTTCLTFALLAGCSVGPDYRRPDAPNTPYTEKPLPESTAASQVPGGESQRFVTGQDIPSQWWTIFHSESLDRLIRQALKDSPTLSAAQAALRQAQENLRARAGTVIFPSLDANATASRQKISGAGFGQPNSAGSIFNLYNASVSVSYALDIFGGGRRELEGLQSQVDYQRFLFEGAYLALTSNIVTTAVKEASLRAQIQATKDILKAQEKQLNVVEQQFQLGGVSLSDVLSKRAQLAQSRALLPPLEKELALTRHLLAVLSGKFPGEAQLPEFSLEGIQMPVELPVSLPSSLVHQRPDIRASEGLLHAASAQVGVATANLYPQITLTGSYGSEAGRLHNLFGNGTSIWGLGASLLQPIFRGGELTAKRRAAIAAYDQATANYQETILLAFQNVADVLRSLDLDAMALKAQADAETAAREALELTQKQFSLGAVSYLSLLDAERRYQQAKIALVQAQAARYADTAALFQALGGGWWNRDSNINE
jgi:NodT family efflux transporter outer membrane factor (OMF) lipoprotein